MSRSLRGWVAFLAMAMVLALPPMAAAQEEATPLRDGVELLRQGQFQAALQLFESLPDDPRARFFAGATLNRLGRFEEAEVRLRSAGPVNRDFDFEVGWSLMGQERFAEALTALRAYEEAHPGRGLTSEFLGRSLYGLERYAEAEEAFAEALRRDPSLEPTVRVYQAAIAERQGDTERAARLIEDFRAAYGATRLGGLISKRGPGGAVAGVATPDKPWTVFLSMGGGYNSNVVALADDFVLPTDISGQASSQAEFLLDGSYHWFLNEDQDEIYAGYALLADLYGSLDSFNLLDHTFYLGSRTQVADDLYFHARTGVELTDVGGQPFRTAWQLRPSLVLRQADWGALEGAAALTTADYFGAFTPPLDRDATTVTTSATQYFFPPGTRLEGRAGYYHSWNNSVGGDFDLQSDGLLIGLTHPLFGELKADVGWQHSFDRYTRLNSLAGPFGFAFKRYDDYNQWSAQLRHPVSDEATLFARWSRASNVSNIPFYGYSRDLWQGGVYFNL